MILFSCLRVEVQVSGKSEKEREEGLKIQIQGTGMMLKLCRDVMNLEQLIQNSTVMGALTRVLQEEYKKSVDLTFNIIRSVRSAVSSLLLDLNSVLQ